MRTALHVITSAVLIPRPALGRAVARFRVGAIWWLDTPQLIAAATAEQEARYQGDAWDARIGRWLTHERRRVNRGFGAFEDWREEEVERAQPIRDVGAPPIARSLSADRGSIRADEAA